MKNVKHAPHIDPLKFRSQAEIEKDLTAYHEKTRAEDKEKREAHNKLTFMKGSLLKALADSPLPTKCKLQKHDEIMDMRTGFDKPFRPTYEEAARILKSECDREIAELVMGKDTAQSRLATIERYNRDIRELTKLRETGQLRLEIS